MGLQTKLRRKRKQRPLLFLRPRRRKQPEPCSAPRATSTIRRMRRRPLRRRAATQPRGLASPEAPTLVAAGSGSSPTGQTARGGARGAQAGGPTARQMQSGRQTSTSPCRAWLVRRVNVLFLARNRPFRSTRGARTIRPARLGRTERLQRGSNACSSGKAVVTACGRPSTGRNPMSLRVHQGGRLSALASPRL